MTLYNPKIPFASLHRGKGWMCLNGEYMNKNKKDGDGNSWNNKFVIFDTLVFNREQKTEQDRQETKIINKILDIKDTYSTIVIDQPWDWGPILQFKETYRAKLWRYYMRFGLMVKNKDGTWKKDVEMLEWEYYYKVVGTNEWEDCTCKEWNERQKEGEYRKNIVVSGGNSNNLSDLLNILKVRAFYLLLCCGTSKCK